MNISSSLRAPGSLRVLVLFSSRVTNLFLRILRAEETRKVTEEQAETAETLL